MTHRPRRGSPPDNSLALLRLTDAPSAGDLAIPDDLVEPVRRLLAAARSVNTHVARRSDWEVFTAWCSARDRRALPATVETILSFVGAQAHADVPKRPATIQRYLASISVAHGGAGVPTPTKDKRVVELMAGVRNALGAKQRLAAPITAEILDVVRPHCDARGWAILCFGQALASRRSELCALDRADVVIDSRGAAVTIRKSKTDQAGEGVVIGVRRLPGLPLCPVAALEAYFAIDRRDVGPLIGGRRVLRLTVKEVERTVKRAVTAAGLDPKLYSAHSLRAGYVTDARRAGQSWVSIMEHTRHADLKTVKGYARYARDPFEVPHDER